MVAAKIDTFGGMVPAVDDTLLPDQSASISQNVNLYNGKLVPLPEFAKIHDTDPATTIVYRLPASYGNASYLYDSVFMEFIDPFTNVIRAPVFGDVYDRYYWFSNNDVPMYNTRARIEAALPPWLLGIEPPTVAPGYVVTGGSGTVADRAYVYTWVSEYGEESAPSPPTLASGFINGSWDLTFTAAAADDIGGPDRNLMYTRIYRTEVALSGIADYFFVDEIPIATLTYSDLIPPSDVTQNGLMDSTNWAPPPGDLAGCVAMPNGILAAWRDNELWFSEPYRPHAWPVAYVQTVDFPIVGLGITNQTLVVCTAGHPLTASGSAPSFITTSKLTSMEPCTGRGSIVSAPEGVYYASPNGLVLVNVGAAANITKDLVDPARWLELTKGTAFRAARWGTAYFGFGSVQPGVFDVGAFDTEAFTQEDTSGSYNGVLIDPMNQRVAYGLLTAPGAILGVTNDPWSGHVLVVYDNGVHFLDNTKPFDMTVHQVGVWRSKKFQGNMPSNVGAMKVYFDVPDSAPNLAPVPNYDLDQDLVDDQYGLVRLFADDRHVMTRELRRSGEMFRPPSGFKAEFWQFEIEFRVKILSVHLAGSPKELQNV